MKKIKLKNLTKKQFNGLAELGMLYEFYPESWFDIEIYE